MPVPGLVSNYKRYISDIQSSLVTCREKKGAQRRRRIVGGTAGSEIDRKGREVRRQCREAGYFSPASMVKLSGGSVCEPAG